MTPPGVTIEVREFWFRKKFSYAKEGGGREKSGVESKGDLRSTLAGKNR
jgi:hypothetical protein